MNFLKKILSPVVSGASTVLTTIGTATGNPALAAIGAGVGSLMGSVSQNSINEDQLNTSKYLQEQQQQFNAEQSAITREFNAEQAQLSRDFNANEAQKQRDFAVDMWNKENEFNSPVAQLQRMQAAGMNPNLFNTQVNQAGNVPSTSAASSSPASASPASSGISGIPNIQNPDLVAAQVRLANAQADKEESTVDVNKANANRVNSLLDGEVKIQGAQLGLLAAQTETQWYQAKKTLRECDLVLQEYRNAQQTWNQIAENVKLLRSQGQLNEAQLNVFYDRVGVEIAREWAEVDFKKAGIVGIYASAQEARAAAEHHKAGAEFDRKQSELTGAKIARQLTENASASFYLVEQIGTMPKRIQMQNAQNGLVTVDADFDANYLNGKWRVIRGIGRGLGVSPYRMATDFPSKLGVGANADKMSVGNLFGR